MGWATVVVQFIATFAFLGIDAIGIAIENPFGCKINLANY
jgi:predicted membrane chloride channel (bestrophin family)